MEFVQGDLFNSPSLLSCIQGAEYIIHLAGVTKAIHKSDFYAGNVLATKNLLEAASQSPHLKKFCFISSLTAVGPSETGAPLDEHACCHPITTYGKSKLEAELLCHQYASRIPIVIVRPPAVFGPRDTDILAFFKWVSYGIRPVLGSISKTVSIVFAPDLAKGIIRATMDERTTGETFYIADPSVYSFSTVIEQLALLIQRKSIRLFLPKAIVYTMAGVIQVLSLVSKKPSIFDIEKARDLLQKHWVCTPKRIEDSIGFHTPTSMAQGMEQTYQWYKKQGWL